MTTISLTNVASTATLLEEGGNFQGFSKFVSVVSILVPLTKKRFFWFDSDFEMLVAFNGRLSSSSGLYSRQTVFSSRVDTLSIMTIVQLFRWDTLTVLVHSDTSYEILKDSTFSVVMHGKSYKHSLCFF